MFFKKKSYKFAVHIWGGYFKKNRQIREGLHVFDAKNERDSFCQELSQLRDGAMTPQMYKFEGMNCYPPFPTFHRIVSYKGKQYYSFRDFNWPDSLENIIDFIDRKWQPGWNDWFLGSHIEDVDYNEVGIIKEWVTGIDGNYEIHEVC